MATNNHSNVTAILPYDQTDIINRGIKRTLPCKMDDVELLKLALQRADKAALRLAVIADFDKLKAKHKAQIEDMDSEIAKADREIHAREQDRVVICTSVFHRSADGSGFVHFYRNDTHDIVEERPCTVSEAQSHLPSMDGPRPKDGPILDRVPAAEPEEDDGTGGVTDIDELARQAEAADGYSYAQDDPADADDRTQEEKAAAGRDAKAKRVASRKGGGK